MNIVIPIIVLFNPEIVKLKKLLDGLTAQVPKIYLIDNGSGNINDAHKLAVEYCNVEIIALGSNYGIAHAHNVGIKASKNFSATHVAIFDQDSSVPVGFIDQLLSAESRLISDGKNVAAVGPGFYDSRTNNTYPFALIDGFTLAKIYPKNNVDYIKASFLISSGSLIRISILDSVGYMNEGFFIDYVDVEWGIRAESLGFESYGIPSVMMEHCIGDKRLKLLGREISIHSPLRRYYLARNGILMMKLPHVPLNYKVRELLYSMTRVIVFLCFVGNKTSYLKYISKGWVDGILGKVGKYEG